VTLTLHASGLECLTQRISRMAIPQNLSIPVHADPLRYELPNLAKRLAAKGAVKIVAIGSSSTAGEGNIVPYPSRLEAMLRDKYQNPLIKVINLGIGGLGGAGGRGAHAGSH
jgi:hypothetical protein